MGYKVQRRLPVGGWETIETHDDRNEAIEGHRFYLLLYRGRVGVRFVQS